MTERCQNCDETIGLLRTENRITDQSGRPIRLNVYLCAGCWSEAINGFSEMKEEYKRLVDSGFSEVDASKIMCNRIDANSERESLVDCDVADGVLMLDG